MDDTPNNKEELKVQVVPHFSNPHLTIEEIKFRRALVREIANEIFDDGVHYGASYPGAKKPSLLKPGAEVFREAFQLSQRFKYERIDLPDGHREWMVTCQLYHLITEKLYGESSGTCSSLESKYRYRNAQRACPTCNATAISKGREDYGGGWYCNKRNNGCGAKFAIHDPRIIAQEVGKTENPDVADQFNTLIKIAEKRAFVSAILIACACSDMFTQDMETDDGHGSEDEAARPTQTKPVEPPPSQPKAPPPTSPSQPETNDKFTRSGKISTITMAGEYVRVGLTNTEGKEGFFFSKGLPPGLPPDKEWPSLKGKFATINGEMVRRPDKTLVYKINDMSIVLAGDPAKSQEPTPAESKKRFEEMKARYDRKDHVLITATQRAELKKEIADASLTDADIAAFLIACHDGAGVETLTQKTFSELMEQLKSGFATQWCLDQVAGNFGGQAA